MSKKDKFLPFIVSLGVGLGVMAIVFVLSVAAKGNDVFQKPRVLMTILCDSSFVSGAILLCVAFLSFATRQGTFDGLGFAVESIFVVRNWSPRRKFKERETFSDYKDRKAEKRKEKKGLLPFYVSGAFYILLAVIFLIVYSYIPAV